KGASTAVYTIADHTAMQDRSQDAKVTVTFAAPKPVLTLSKSAGLAAGGETVTVTGENYNPSQAMYLTLCSDVPLEEVSFAFISAGCTSGAKLVTPSPRSPSMVKLEADGSFTTQFTVTSKGASTAVYTIADHTAMQDRSQDAKVTVTFAAPEPTGPVLTVTPSTDVDPAEENTFTITGSGYTGPGAASGAYVLLGDAAIWSGDGPLVADGWLAQAWVRPAQIVDGAFTTTITVPKGSFDPSKRYVVASSAAHGLSVTDRSLDAFAPITVKAGTTPPVTPPTKPPTKPVTPPKPAKPTIPGGSLSWGVNKDFTDYVTGKIAKGSITVTGGATKSGDVFQFGQTGGSFTATANRGTAEYGGTIGFSGHGGQLALTFADPTLRVMSPTAGILSVVVDGTRVDLASVDFGAAARSTSNGAVRFAGAPVTLLSTGVAAFNGFYGAGQALAPLTAVLGAPAAAPAGETGVVATVAAAKPARAIPGTPPATTGIDLDQATLAALVAGEQVTVSVGGFEPNETDVHVVVYSEPIVLARDLQADAAGVVTWTGALPAGLEAGEHTLTFQGSVAKGVRFALAAPSGQCAVAGATLDWGVKESFRSYLSSGIANGSWEVQGATETDGVFGFTGGTGAFDASAERGTVAFGGSIRFTGHEGVLDTTVSNPGLEFDGTAVAYLTLDVSGTTQDGTPVEAKRVRFAELNLSSGFAAEEGSLVGTAVPATLTADGAAAFGTYGAGEELDPVDFLIPLAADCGVVVAVDDEASAEVAIDDEAATDASATAAGVPSWLLWAGLGLIVAALVALVIVLLMRARRSAA
ncbi:HtaA domain-containing protein, partial [Agromyces sp. NPDC058104]|uniref:HtaA domain-containing protein n=1 Tax=Agromyces sp. NPDC058104 TaxID=3346342 RepID=UPI0036D7CFB4